VEVSTLEKGILSFDICGPPSTRSVFHF